MSKLLGRGKSARFEELQDQYDLTIEVHKQDGLRCSWRGRRIRSCRFYTVLVFDLSVMKSH